MTTDVHIHFNVDSLFPEMTPFDEFQSMGLFTEHDQDFLDVEDLKDLDIWRPRVAPRASLKQEGFA